MAPSALDNNAPSAGTPEVPSYYFGPKGTVLTGNFRSFEPGLLPSTTADFSGCMLVHIRTSQRLPAVPLKRFNHEK